MILSASIQPINLMLVALGYKLVAEPISGPENIGSRSPNYVETSNIFFQQDSCPHCYIVHNLLYSVILKSSLWGIHTNLHTNYNGSMFCVNLNVRSVN